jgi:GDPmannose 4,6-dehydratase
VSAAAAPPRRALITGIAGQDGSFLAELLLAEGYRVTGLVRDRGGQAGEESARDPLGCSEHLRSRIELVYGELLAPASLRAAVERVRPDELYHLAAPSFVPASWQRPEQTMRAIAGSAAAIVEAVRDLQLGTRVFVSASGAIFGETPVSPQREDTPCRPLTPYAVAKLAAHQLIGRFRAHDGLYAGSGILFNHESERRPEHFVTRKITRGAAAIALGQKRELALGDLNAVRDWSFAGDIVRGAWLMLQQERADDYVLASGAAHTVADFANAAFACVGLEAERHIRVDQALVRAPEPTPSVGDPSKAAERLGWAPEIGFEQLIERMVQADLRELSGAGTS